MVKNKRSGFALPAVLGILALTSLACATVWRMQWVNQQLLNVQSHLIRNQHIAEGVLPLVLQDIVGFSATNSTNIHATPDSSTSLRHFAGTDAQTHAFYPTTAQERDKLQLRLGNAMCQAGICAPKTPVDLSAEQWRNLLNQSQPVSMADLPSSNVSAFYWVEVWLNANVSELVGSPLLQTTPAVPSAPFPFIYRITVLVQDASSNATSELSKPRPNTLVIQAIWSRVTATALTGQWHSWKLLA
ncbi:MAG: hypothetical protein NTU46_03815 [Burkholderiales bacterium]|nr:hypothetical protein [Burkholderiales bacterium]